MSNQLREYQNELIEKIHESFESNQSVLLQMPTGTGKTMVFSKIIKDFLEVHQNKRIFVLVHRKELLQQTITRLYDDYGLRSSVVASKMKTDWNHRIIVCMVQTLKNKVFKNINRFPSLMVIDEAHHTASKTYEDIIEYMLQTESKLLGVTATPVRLDGKLLAKYYNKIIISHPLRWFIENNYLSKLKFLGIDDLYINQLPVNRLTQEYDEEEAFKLMTGKKVIKDVIDSIQTYTYGKKTLIFSVNQEHSRVINQKLLKIGIKSAVVDATTPDEERNSLINQFKNNEISTLINVQIFTEGFDCPDIEAVVMARPTKSLTLYLQMIGRVTRNPKYPCENTGIVLDNAGNWRELGLPTFEHDWEKEFNIEFESRSNYDEKDWIPAANMNEKTMWRRLQLPIELINLQLKELLIEGDPSYDSNPLIPRHSIKNENKQLNPNIILCEINKNLYYIEDGEYFIFFINNEFYRILNRAYFFILDEFRRHIKIKSEEIATFIIKHRNGNCKNVIIRILKNLSEVKNQYPLTINTISKYHLITSDVADEDIPKKIFELLWISFKLL